MKENRFINPETGAGIHFSINERNKVIFETATGGGYSIPFPQPEMADNFMRAIAHTQGYTQEASAPMEKTEELQLQPIETEQDVTDFFSLLTHPANHEHFSPYPLDYGEFLKAIQQPDIHAYMVRDEGVMVGAGVLADAPRERHDNWLEKIVVNPYKQNKGMGTRLIRAFTETAFTTPNHDGRTREKVVYATIGDVEGWERMDAIAKKLGFTHRSTLPRQIEREGKFYPVNIYDVLRVDWQK